ncbi:nitrite reductase small subunit NirD [Pseudomonas sp. CFBP 13727]|uniref:nitrite reductase small subunit NirD n=1 Tax=Pseudomonas sp. CFBP 13727 TaxID=2775295 RepID=UPI001781CDDA|nr:nitrite reductase small subunit NirD [Pseudomonas sp. CFBP 13727]MBD8622188.1 nitrite reductase small subunit NirD [Pseudomonas sp. CFBP 13727]
MQAAKAVQAMDWQAVCDRADLISNSGVVVWLHGDQVAVFYLPDAGEGRVLHAIDNHDPRSGANVLGRGIVGYLQGELVVAAPLYKQHYCFSDGRCLEAPEQGIRVWPVRFNGDRVEIGRV